MRIVPLQFRAILRPVATLCLMVSAATAHPGSGIVVDRQGQIYFVDTGQGVWKVDVKGRLLQHDGPAFHWTTIDHDGRFAKTRLPSSSTSEVRQAGVNPTLILSSDFPLTTGHDGALYYPELAPDDRLKIIRLEPSGAHAVLATLPASTEGSALRWVNGMAAGPYGSIYYTENKAVRKITQQGIVSTIAANVSVPDCSPIPGAGAHLGALLRGLAAGPDGSLYVAASGCCALLKITARGEVTPVLRAASPWSPTGVAVARDDVYVLEYMHTASDRREWAPRVRKISPDGKVTTVATAPTRRRMRQRGIG